MAGKDRIGALYYEVILDPKGYARGAASVKKEEDLLVRAVKKTTNKMQEIEAELKAVVKASLKAEGEKRKLLRGYAKELLKDKKKLIAEEKAAKDAAVADDKKRRDEADAKEYASIVKRQLWRRKLIENTRKMEEKAHADEMKRLRRARAARQKERDWFKWKFEAISRLMKKESAGAKTTAARLRALPKLFGAVTKSVGGSNSVISKFAGNLAQAMGLNPAVQGMVRTFGLLGAKVLVLGTVLVGTLAVLYKAAQLADKWKLKEIQLAAVMQGRGFLAKALEKDMLDLARSTAFSAEQAMDLAIALKVAGVATKDVRGMAETIGALGMGDPEKMKFIQKAWTDVLTKGKLMGQEALQLANQGVPIYKALAGSMGISASKAKELATAGKISAAQFKLAMEYQAEAVGGTEAMEAAMWTIGGQWQQTKDAVWDLMITIGKQIQPALTWVMWTLKVLTQLFVKLVKFAMTFTKYLLTPWKIVTDSVQWLMEKTGYAVESAAEYADEMARAAAEADEVSKAQQKTADALLEKEQDATRDPEEIKRRDHRRELNKLIEEEKITKEQALRIVRERGWQERKAEMARAEEERLKRIAEQDEARDKRKQKRLEEQAAKAKADAEKLVELKDEAFERAEEARKADIEAAEEANRKQLEGIQSRLDEQISQREDADSSSGAAFEAGSAEEHQFLREMEMQARRDKMIEQWEQKADAERTAANAHLLSMKSNINSMANNDKARIAAADDLSDFGYP